jgi:hypothetical protein
VTFDQPLRKYGAFDFIVDGLLAATIYRFAGSTIMRFKEGNDDKDDKNDKPKGPPEKPQEKPPGEGLGWGKSLFSEDKKAESAPEKKNKIGVENDIFR